jgi:hypothetical protein
MGATVMVDLARSRLTPPIAGPDLPNATKAPAVTSRTTALAPQTRVRVANRRPHTRQLYVP